MNQTGEIRTEQQGDVVIFVPEGDLGGLSFTDDQAAMYGMLETVEEQAVPRVVVDLAGLRFADSTLLAVLVSVWKRITARGGQMVLASVPPDIADVLRYTKLDALWIAYPSRDAALQALNKG